MRNLILGVLLSVLGFSAPARGLAPRPADSPRPLVSPAQLQADYWIQRLPKQHKTPVLDGRAIAAQNARLQLLDHSVFDVEALPASLHAEQVRAWIDGLSELPTVTVWDEFGVEVDKTTLSALRDSLQLDALPAVQSARFGLVTARADLRTFPTRLRVFSSRGDTDIDRFQESALFPGTPVLIAHESLDHQWWFVVSPSYAAWLEKDRVAEGPKALVFDYTRKSPSLVITGATERTVYTPELPAVSQLQLDMGVRLPLLADWPANQPVNGQNPSTAHVVELPLRDPDGSLRLVPALLPRTADVQTHYLPLQPASILRQGFKFLGERYGWGHDYDARDCSGFVSEVYRSFGVRLPRNTRDQGVSPALNRLVFTETSDRAMRLAAVRSLRVGDLIYIPGHVMMVIGFDRGQPYVIHDTTGTSLRDGNGGLARVVLNGVSVTPLLPLMFNQTQTYVDRMYSIQRIRP